ncbi:1-acyl-sn-glycerol-3-phosphate acyltransferase [Pasteurellaceae bacterium USgator11]|nr:1-acyl-sn-glycerol-3-phosphate acyltransferase [Pasteurellaceae bacterium UScroc12]TNG94703.1 1-acyl-sn-glycerol-3-phosphate acyltransferase [Pasteurellaceae bacterium USgator41]TNG98930.1 1-acyl-sn-glycerol-3-phosphate acyltransferase [Pasteurellaceae bacterium UScroc31]TNH01229.1 1-acyl-sn-glycerol-3-phosphate acyltransferase [Pasteurellaceae bacterium USgator11]
MQTLRVFWRLSWIMYYLLSGVFQMLVLFRWCTPQQKLARIQRWSQNILRVFNIQVNAHNVPHLSQVKGSMFISNHVSWLDIFAINAVLPGQFIAKDDVRKWPIIGYLAAQANTVFVSRQRGNGSTQGKVDGVATALRNGAQITLFPEGTSTIGDQVLPFKSSFFQAAIDAEAKIWPVLCFYPAKNGGINRTMAYYGDISLVQSLKDLAAQKCGVIELNFFEAIDATGKDRRDLCDLSHQILSTELVKALERSC